eukprot:2516085-Heterocapsa_arctica.AAC.1
MAPFHMKSIDPKFGTRPYIQCYLSTYVQDRLSPRPSSRWRGSCSRPRCTSARPGSRKEFSSSGSGSNRS